MPEQRNGNKQAGAEMAEPPDPAFLRTPSSQAFRGLSWRHLLLEARHNVATLGMRPRKDAPKALHAENAGFPIHKV